MRRTVCLQTSRCIPHTLSWHLWQRCTAGCTGCCRVQAGVRLSNATGQWAMAVARTSAERPRWTLWSLTGWAAANPYHHLPHLWNPTAYKPHLGISRPCPSVCSRRVAACHTTVHTHAHAALPTVCACAPRRGRAADNARHGRSWRPTQRQGGGASRSTRERPHPSQHPRWRPGHRLCSADGPAVQQPDHA